MSTSVGFISLGCAKNQIDCEQMMFLLRQAGYRIAPAPESADLVIVNVFCSSTPPRARPLKTSSAPASGRPRAA